MSSGPASQLVDVKFVACGMSARFRRYIGIDYSGAETPDSGLKGLRVFASDGFSEPREQTVAAPKKYWTRRGLALWLTELLSEDIPTIVGIDHGFSFPLKYFEKHALPLDWPAFLDDFQHHWPTDGPHMYVDFAREGPDATGIARLGNARWRRLTEVWTGSAKSVFHFDVPGSVAKATHAGLPWLRYIRAHAKPAPHVWPFDGWTIPEGRSALVEVYPRVWNREPAPDGWTGDQYDAFVITEWLRRADADGRLEHALQPALSDAERRTADVEGWILGVMQPSTPTVRTSAKPSATDLLDRIVSDPAILAGRPCVRGQGTPVAAVLALLAAGRSWQQVLRRYPNLTLDDVRACLAFAAERLR